MSVSFHRLASVRCCYSRQFGDSPRPAWAGAFFDAHRYTPKRTSRCSFASRRATARLAHV